MKVIQRNIHEFLKAIPLSSSDLGPVIYDYPDFYDHEQDLTSNVIFRSPYIQGPVK